MKKCVYALVQLCVIDCLKLTVFVIFWFPLFFSKIDDLTAWDDPFGSTTLAAAFAAVHQDRESEHLNSRSMFMDGYVL